MIFEFMQSDTDGSVWLQPDEPPRARQTSLKASALVKLEKSENRWLSKSNLAYFHIENQKQTQTLEHHHITTPRGDGDDDVDWTPMKRQ